MAMQTFIPPITPDQGMEVSIDPKIAAIAFNDGYQQEIPDGINNALRKSTASWTNLRKTEADPIILFIEPVAKTREPFWWTPNGESTPRAIKVMRWTYKWKKGKYCDISIEWEETATRA